ncbi:hypothetical protein F5887DRAFT_931436 [Amanita rubescens]|nr:hypothetical protein F5887DRAFT_931436 [Amanita rubescens]
MNQWVERAQTRDLANGAKDVVTKLVDVSAASFIRKFDGQTSVVSCPITKKYSSHARQRASFSFPPVFTLRITGVNGDLFSSTSSYNGGIGERCKGSLRNLVDLVGGERLNVSFALGIIADKERAVDYFQALYCKTAYRNPGIHPYHLSMPCLIMKYALVEGPSVHQGVEPEKLSLDEAGSLSEVWKAEQVIAPSLWLRQTFATSSGIYAHKMMHDILARKAHESSSSTYSSRSLPFYKKKLAKWSNRAPRGASVQHLSCFSHGRLLTSSYVDEDSEEDWVSPIFSLVREVSGVRAAKGIYGVLPNGRVVVFTSFGIATLGLRRSGTDDGISPCLGGEDRETLEGVSIRSFGIAGRGGITPSSSELAGGARIRDTGVGLHGEGGRVSYSGTRSIVALRGPLPDSADDSNGTLSSSDKTGWTN